MCIRDRFESWSAATIAELPANRTQITEGKQHMDARIAEPPIHVQRPFSMYAEETEFVYERLLDNQSSR